MTTKSSKNESTTTDSPHWDYATNEKVKKLEERINKLSTICNQLNPYQPLDKEFQLRLKEFNIYEFDDPFKITNALLMLLEDSIDELHIYKPADPNEIWR
jgi:hypothetical protein